MSMVIMENLNWIDGGGIIFCHSEQNEANMSKNWEYEFYPNLDDEVKQEFGISEAEVEKKIREYNGFGYYNSFLKHQERWNPETWQGYENPKQWILNSNDEKYARMKQNLIWSEKFDQILEFKSNHPKTKEFEKSRQEYYDQHKSFIERGLDLPGTLIELENGELILIGHPSQCLFDDVLLQDLKVKRYCILYDFKAVK